MNPKSLIPVLLGVFLALTLLIAPPAIRPAKAFGIPTFDGTNWEQNFVTALESIAQDLNQIAQIKVQLEAYRNMIINTLNGSAFNYTWDSPQGSINNLLDAVYKVDQYKQMASDMQNYLNKIHDFAQYRKFACLTGDGECTPDEKAEIAASVDAGSEAEIEANKTFLQNIEKEKENIRRQAAHLQELQEGAEDAEGRMAALNYANKFSNMIAAQLMAIRSLLLAQREALSKGNTNTYNRKNLADTVHTKLTEIPPAPPGYQPSVWIGQ